MKYTKPPLDFPAQADLLLKRGLGSKQPAIPRSNKHPDWHTPVAITADRLFGIMTVLHYLLLLVAPQSRWRDRLTSLFDAYADIPKRFMGFPDNWESSPLWAADTAKATPTTPIDARVR